MTSDVENAECILRSLPTEGSNGDSVTAEDLGSSSDSLIFFLASAMFRRSLYTLSLMPRLFLTVHSSLDILAIEIDDNVFFLIEVRLTLSGHALTEGNGTERGGSLCSIGFIYSNKPVSKYIYSLMSLYCMPCIYIYIYIEDN